MAATSPTPKPEGPAPEAKDEEAPPEEEEEESLDTNNPVDLSDTPEAKARAFAWPLGVSVGGILLIRRWRLWESFRRDSIKSTGWFPWWWWSGSPWCCIEPPG